MEVTDVPGVGSSCVCVDGDRLAKMSYEEWCELCTKLKAVFGGGACALSQPGVFRVYLPPKKCAAKVKAAEAVLRPHLQSPQEKREH
jgi:hypothetical protein